VEAGIVASGDRHGIIILRNRSDGRFLRMLDSHDGGVSVLAFHPDGSRLASASPQRPGPDVVPSVILWDLHDDSPIWTYHDDKPNAAINAMIYPRGDRLLIGTSDGRLLRLEARTGRVVSTIEGDPSGIKSIDSLSDGRHVLILNRRGHLQVRDAESLTLCWEWDADNDTQAAVFLSEEVVVTGGRAIRLRDARSGRVLLNYEVADGPVHSLSVRPRARQLAYADQGNVAHRLDLNDLQRQLRDLNLAIPSVSP
jgi:WD40 repeat protein